MFLNIYQRLNYLDIEKNDPDWNSIFPLALSTTSFENSRIKDTATEDTIRKNSENLESSEHAKFTNDETTSILKTNDQFYDQVSLNIELSLMTQLGVGSISADYNNDTEKMDKYLLKEFTENPKKSRKKDRKPIINQRIVPKKEYLRVKLIRGHKRATRDAFLKKIPRKTINRVNLKNPNQKAAWEIFENFACNNRDILYETSKTINGPLTDGESENKRIYGDDFKKKVNKERTFNNQYCKAYFSDPIVRQSFALYIDVLFSDNSIESYCQKFNFVCCRNFHSEICVNKWNRLNIYAKAVLTDTKDIEVLNSEVIADNEFSD